jgi:hypothetical protein
MCGKKKKREKGRLIRRQSKKRNEFISVEKFVGCILETPKGGKKMEGKRPISALGMSPYIIDNVTYT